MHIDLTKPLLPLRHSTLLQNPYKDAISSKQRTQHKLVL
jgi:hypothetical protein